MAGIEAFEKTTQLTQMWVNDVARELEIEDKRKAFQGLRATLHVLRDRLTPGEAAHLGAQLPILLAGFYYEGWKPDRSPVVARSKDEFLNQLRSHLHTYFQKEEAIPDAEQLARAVFMVIAVRISTGEVEDITGILSPDLRELFPQGAAV